MMIDFVRHFLIIAIISLTLLAIAFSFFSRFILPAMRLREDLQATIERVKPIKGASKGKITDLDEISQVFNEKGQRCTITYLTMDGHLIIREGETETELIHEPVSLGWDL